MNIRLMDIPTINHIPIDADRDEQLNDDIWYRYQEVSMDIEKIKRYVNDCVVLSRYLGHELTVDKEVRLTLSLDLKLPKDNVFTSVELSGQVIGMIATLSERLEKIRERLSEEIPIHREIYRVCSDGIDLYEDQFDTPVDMLTGDVDVSLETLVDSLATCGGYSLYLSETYEALYVVRDVINTYEESLGEDWLDQDEYHQEERDYMIGITLYGVNLMNRLEWTLRELKRIGRQVKIA